MNKIDVFIATVYDLNPDVIGVTESWATPEILHSELHIDGYEVFRRDRATPNRGGGVLLYVKSALQPTEYTVRSDFDDSVWCKMGTLLIGDSDSEYAIDLITH